MAPPPRTLGVTVVSIREVTRDNWREALALSVHPEQHRFVADSTPIATIALAKAYVRPAGRTWVPYAVYADALMVGFVELSYEPESLDRYWIYHFFIHGAHQSKGYGKRALRAFVDLVRERHPRCRMIRLTVHPEHLHARHVYTSIGFQRTDGEIDGEPVYSLVLR